MPERLADVERRTSAAHVPEEAAFKQKALEVAGNTEFVDQVVRERAYTLWEQAGRPEGRAEDFWRQAEEQRFRERAYALWEREDCPAGKADEHWFQIRGFEEN